MNEYVKSLNLGNYTTGNEQNNTTRRLNITKIFKETKSSLIRALNGENAWNPIFYNMMNQEDIRVWKEVVEVWEEYINNFEENMKILNSTENGTTENMLSGLNEEIVEKTKSGLIKVANGAISSIKSIDSMTIEEKKVAEVWREYIENFGSNMRILDSKEQHGISSDAR